jgi:hypothetical protein
VASSNDSFASTSRPDEEDSSADTHPEFELGQAALDRTAILRLIAERAELTWSAVGAVSADHATLQKSTAGVVVTKSAAVDRSRVGVLASPVVRGDVHTWLDLRTAFAAGVGFFLGKLLVDFIRSALRR